MPQRPKFSTIAIFALGQFGWTLASFGALNLLNYFYLPPETQGRAGFSAFIFPGAVFGIFTAIGLIGFSTRFFDGILDALIANWSDRRMSKTTKRRLPMGLAALPLAVFAALVFFPAKQEIAAANSWWLLAGLLVFYFFFSLYTVPFTALLAEIGHDPRDRMRLSTAISVAGGAALLLGSNVYLLQDLLEKRGFSPVSAFQMTVSGFSALGFLAMLVPVFFMDEKKYALQNSASPKLHGGLKTVFSNRNFRSFVAADFMYWLALTFIQTGTVYYITAVFGFEKTRAAEFLNIAGIGSFLLYWPVIWLVGQVGKRRVILAAFWVFAAIFVFVSMAGRLPISTNLLFYGLAVAATFPLSAFGIIPMAMLSDIIFEEEKRSGQQLPGLFFAVRAFTMKVGISLANLIFPSLLLLGKSAENPAGLRAAAVLAVGFCVFGLLFFRKYRDV